MGLCIYPLFWAWFHWGGQEPARRLRPNVGDLWFGQWASIENLPTKYSIQDDPSLKQGECIDLVQRRWLYFTELGLETIKLIASSNPIDVRLLENEEGFLTVRELNSLERLLHYADRRRRDFERVKVENWGTLQADYEVQEH